MSKADQATAAPVSDEDQMAAALQEIRSARMEDVKPADAASAQPDAAAVVDAAAQDPEKQPDAAAAAAKPAADAQAPAAEKTPEQKLADVQAELHRAQSEIGRVSALNRANQEKAQRIAELERELQSARKPPETPSEALTELAGLREKVKDFPELKDLVEVVDKALKEVDAKAQTSAKAAAQEAVRPLEPLRQRDQDQRAEEQRAADQAAERTFTGTYPTAVEVIRTDDFKQWLPKQSQAIQWAFHKGQTPSDALPVMDAYDAHLRRIGKPSIAVAPQTTQQPAAEEPKTTEAKPGDDRLRRAAGIPSRQTNGSKGALPPADDFDGSLEFFRKQRLEKARAAA
jgi:hypothetical protein